MFRIHEFDVQPGAKFLPVDTYYAVAIAGGSLIDMVRVDGEPVAPGAPLLLDGTKRALKVEAIRKIAGFPVRLLVATDACGLGALPSRRAPLWDYWSLGGPRGNPVWTDTYTDNTICVAGRRHIAITALSGDSGVPSDGVLTVTGHRYRLGTPFVDSNVLHTSALEMGVKKFLDVGGTDHEECYEALTIRVASDSSFVVGHVWVNAFGELGA